MEIKTYKLLHYSNLVGEFSKPIKELLKAVEPFYQLAAEKEIWEFYQAINTSPARKQVSRPALNRIENERRSFMEQIITPRESEERRRTLQDIIEDARSSELSIEEQAIIEDVEGQIEEYAPTHPELKKRLDDAKDEINDAYDIVARQKDLSLIYPPLKEFITASREFALAARPNEEPYSYFLSDYNSVSIDEISKLLTDALPRTREVYHLTRTDESENILDKSSPETQKEKEFFESLAKQLGFSSRYGTIHKGKYSVTFVGDGVHPVLAEDLPSLRERFADFLHEVGGHGVLDQELHTLYEERILRQAVSLDVHETQAALMESQLGMDPIFIEWSFSQIGESLGTKENLAEVLRAHYQSRASLDRDYSGCAPYLFHITARFELERGLLNGTIEPKDANDVWFERIRSLFGVEPKSTHGKVFSFLDSYWEDGELGYLPAYYVANVAAAQLYEQFKKDTPDWKEYYAQGKFRIIKDWASEKFHKQALRPLNDILVHATGSSLNPEAYLRFLESHCAFVKK